LNHKVNIYIVKNTILKNYTTDQVRHDTLNYFIIWLVSLLSIKFYSLFVSYSAGKALVMFGAIIVFTLYLFNIVYNKSKEYEKMFTIPVLIIFLCLIISSFAANYFYNQPLLSTLFGQFELYLFLFYFLLHKIKPSLEALTNMFVILGLIYCLIYFVQFLIYPKLILTCGMFKDRGTLRIFMPGIDYMVSAYYIILSRYIIKNKAKLLLLLIPILVVLFLMGTRQALGIVLLMTILMILFSKRVKSKFLIFLLIALCMLPIFYIFQNIILNMLNVSVQQSANAQEYVRVRAAQYYLYSFNHNSLWILTGNGNPAPHSYYGNAIERITKTTGYYLSDVGLIGDFFKYGILYALVQLFILYRLAKTKLHDQYLFIRYNAFTCLLALFVGAGMNSQALVLLCMSMYIMDVDKKEIALEKKLIRDRAINN
jgi:hypothetical protein